MGGRGRRGYGGGGACCCDVGTDGGGGAEEVDDGGFLVVGEAEEETEVARGESALGVVFVEAGDAGGEGLAEGGVGVVGVGAVDDAGDELEGEGGVDAVAAALAEAA